MIPKSVRDFQSNQLGLSGVAAALKFELKSILGRLLYKPKQEEYSSKQYLNIGSGSSEFENFVSLDFYCFKKTHRANVMHDLRYPLPFPSKRFEGIFSEHCLEHLDPLAASRLLESCMNVLKPGGVIRLSLPSLKYVISFYTNPVGHPLEEQYAFGLEAVRCLTQNWGHVSVYDEEYTQFLLESAGFVDLKVCEFKESRLHGLAVEQEVRRSVSFYIEAIKPQ